MSWTLLTLLAACGGPTPDPVHHHEGELHGATVPGTPIGLSLDSGVRWKMDPHTRAVLVETRAALAGAEVGSVDEAKVLGARLQAQLDRLIQGCTMTGPAHDQLHAFLAVYAPAVASLSRATDLAAAELQVATLRDLIAEYDRFFE